MLNDGKMKRNLTLETVLLAQGNSEEGNSLGNVKKQCSSKKNIETWVTENEVESSPVGGESEEMEDIDSDEDDFLPQRAFSFRPAGRDVENTENGPAEIRKPSLSITQAQWANTGHAEVETDAPSLSQSSAQTSVPSAPGKACANRSAEGIDHTGPTKKRRRRFLFDFSGCRPNSQSSERDHSSSSSATSNVNSGVQPSCEELNTQRQALFVSDLKRSETNVETDANRSGSLLSISAGGKLPSVAAPAASPSFYASSLPNSTLGTTTAATETLTSHKTICQVAAFTSSAPHEEGAGLGVSSSVMALSQEKIDKPVTQTQLVRSKTEPVRPSTVIQAERTSRNLSSFTKIGKHQAARRQRTLPGWATSTSKPTLMSSAALDQEFRVMTDEQRKVIELAREGKSIFFTGCAGTGKSLVLRNLVVDMKRIHGTESVYVTASTGIAAVNIGGTTLHSFAGIGIGEGTIAQLVAKVRKDKPAVRRINSAEVLVVDEVSMISAELFEKVDEVLKRIRRAKTAFGGIQVILCGDFLQLPPVAKKGDVQFCFESPMWTCAVDTTVILKKVFRQEGDSQFLDVLMEAREGRISPHSLRLLNSRLSAPMASDDGIVPTKLYSYRRDVESENNACLAELSGEARTYVAIDRGEKYFVESLKRNCQAPTELTIKIGAQVMLLKNLDLEAGLCNGSRGVVIDFKEQSPDEQASRTARERLASAGFFNVPIVRFANGVERQIGPEKWTTEIAGEVKAARDQIPLSLAWAISIHKSQGMTIDRVEMDLASVFVYVDSYRARSGVCRTLTRHFNERIATVKLQPDQGDCPSPCALVLPEPARGTQP